MSRISRPIFTVYSGKDNSLDASKFDTTPDLRPVVYVPSLDLGACAVPYDPRSFGFNPRDQERKPVKPVREAAPWPEEHMPRQGHADQRERGVRDLARYGGGDADGTDQSIAIRSVPRSEPQASAKVATAETLTDDADGHGAENGRGANRLASPSRGWLSSIARGLIGLWGRWQRHREMSRAIEALSRLDDRSLRDIGIHHRLQIRERVRFEP